MVTPEKVRRVRRATEAWLAARPELVECEIALEAAVVRGRRIERLPL
jgi:Holliday junction resolvase-like predicted endonuclease